VIYLGNRLIVQIARSCSVIFRVSARSRVRFRVRVSITVRDPLYVQCNWLITHCLILP